MKYTSLKEDIISILNSSDNNFILKLYDDDGSVIIETSNTRWIYIENKNIIITLPSDDDATITIWSSNETLPQGFDTIIQRLRELSILNGLSVQTKLFDTLDRRKIYNIIKSSIISNKENKMNESVYNVMVNINKTINKTKKPSDYYISESLHTSNVSTLIESFNKISFGINDLNNNKIKSFLNKIYLESSIKNIRTIVDVFSKKHPSEFKKIYENINSLNNLCSFIKTRYLNNIDCKNTSNIKYILENVIVYKTSLNNNVDNITKAYNHLVSVSNGITKGIDLLRAIKKHKICETYSVSKDDLLDMWLSKDANSIIKPVNVYILENVNGDKINVSYDMKPSLHLLSKYINENGLENDIVFEGIINETIKFNSLTSLFETYMYKPELKQYLPFLRKLYKESYTKITNKELIKDDFISYSKFYNYSNSLGLLESKLGFKHPALKYIAIKETEDNHKKSIILENNKKNDINILKSNIKNVTSFVNAEEVSQSIVNNNINLIKPLKSNLTPFDKCKFFYESAYTSDDKANDTLKNCLFLYITNPLKFNSKRKKFIETLEKYVRD